MSIWQRKANGTQAVLYSKKAPKHDKKETQYHFNGVVLGFFFVMLRVFLRIKPTVCRLLFFAILTRCPRFITATVRFRDRNEHFSLYREKAGEEKEGERRLWERCVNRLRFSTVSIAAAREKRERWLSRSGGLPPLFCSPFSP